MRILVTGGAGFIGSNLVEELAGEHEVIVLDNFHTGSMENLRNVQDKVEIVRASCCEILNLKLPSPDIIFHFGIPSSSPMYKENPRLVGEAINDAICIFEFARQNGCKKVIFASTSSIYNGLPLPFREDMQPKVTDYYTEARIAIERIAKLYYELHDVKSIGLRFFSIYGFHERAKGKYANVVTQFLWDMKEDRQPLIFGDGNQTRDFTFVKDVVQICKLAMDSDLNCEIINVGTGKSHSFNEVVDILNKLLGKDIKPKYVENPIKNYVWHTLADPTKMQTLLGFTPRYSLEEGIKELLKEEE